MMIDAIVDEAQDLKKSGVRNSQDVESLRQAIAEVWRNHSLSKDDSNLIRVASIIVAELSSGKKADRTPPSPIRLNEKGQLPVESTVEEEKLAFELLEIAGLFYQGRIEEGLERVKTLRYEIKLAPISATSSPDEIATFIHKAVVRSFEIGRGDGYLPSSQEILELLEEASTLS
ncbi:MAG: hypothetical protein AAGE99_02250 [Chlamydiota bacterium]